MLQPKMDALAGKKGGQYIIMEGINTLSLKITATLLH
jgi:hypothetical protein